MVISNGVSICPATGKLMQPEIAIANWRNWQSQLPCKPEIVGVIGAGLSNRSYLLNAGGQQMVLRINADGSALPGIDRDREATICRAASHAGIAPQLMHAEHRYFVSEFVAGQSLANASLTDTLVVQAFDLISQCHLLNVDVATLDYESHIQRYWDLIEKNAVQVDESLLQQKQSMQIGLHALLSSQSETVLCHHDPVKANFVGSSSRLFLIDWEYAAKGMAVMDYAAVAIEWGIDDLTVLKSSGVHPEELSHAKSLYKYMCQLWTMAQKCNPRIEKN